METASGRDLVQVHVRLLSREAERLVLPRPFGWHVDEASNAHAAREAAVDRRFDETGGEESQRDCHINLPRAAVFPRGDGRRTCCWISDKFIKASDGGEQSMPPISPQVCLVARRDG